MLRLEKVKTGYRKILSSSEPEVIDNIVIGYAVLNSLAGVGFGKLHDQLHGGAH